MKKNQYIAGQFCFGIPGYLFIWAAGIKRAVMSTI